MAVNLEKHPLVSRWVCGRRYAGSYKVAEVKFRETPKQLVVDEKLDDGRNKRILADLYVYGSHFAKTDENLHLTREAAIAHRVEKLRNEIDSLSRKVGNLCEQVDEVLALQEGSTGGV